MYYNFYNNKLPAIGRKNINRMLSAANVPRLVTVTAGAGYGKSTAVCAYLSDSGAKVIWLTLTSLDNYHAHLWENMMNSAKGATNNFPDELEKRGFPLDLASMHQLIEIISHMRRTSNKYVLVLDDYHLITEYRIKNFFKDIANADIPNMSIYILSRENIDILDDQEENTLALTEKDLAFSIVETGEYLSLMDINVSDDILMDIHHNKTHGWPFAIYLTAISLKNHLAIANHSFSFSDKLLFETINHEVFSKFSSEEQTFLLQLSLLDFYPKKLIEDVFAKISPNQMNTLSQNTFINYHHHAHTYHFHQLFRDFLNSKVHLLDNQQRKNILTICGTWYLEHDLIIDALNCYRRIPDFEKTWELIFNIFPDFISIEFANMLLEIMDEFPEAFINENPMIYQCLSLLQMLSGSAGYSKKKCEEYIRILQTRSDTPENRRAIGELYITQGLTAMYTGNTNFKQYFQAADNYLTGPSHYFGGKPWTLLLNGNPINLKDGRKDALESWVSAIEESAYLLEKLLNNNMVGLEALARGAAYYYQNDFKSAEAFLHKALQQGLNHNRIDIICQAYFLLIRLAFGKSDYTATIKCLNTIKDYISSEHIPPMLNIADVSIAWFYAEIGLDSEIPAWISSEDSFASDIYIQAQGFERIIKAHCLLNDGNYGELIAYLLSSQIIYRKYYKFIYLIYTYILLSIAYYKTDQTEEFIRSFHTAYTLAHDNNIIQPFIEIRNYSRLLLSNIAKQKETPMKDSELQTLLDEIDDEWLATLQKKAATWTKMANTVRHKFIAENPVFNHQEVRLSKNEQEVLEYISNGLTRDEIADSMNISTNTIKVVIRTLYSKLGARNSAHAIHIAMQKGLIH